MNKLMRQNHPKNRWIINNFQKLCIDRFSVQSFPSKIIQRSTIEMSTAGIQDNNFLSKSKNGFRNAQTGLQYSEDSLSYEVEAERQYVARLKQQRQRVQNRQHQIQALYAKYDKLLAELSRKEKVIKEQEQKISELDYECRSLSLMTPELEFMRGQNSEVTNENSLLRSNLGKLEKQYHYLTNEFRNKVHMKNQEKEEFTARNQELVHRIRIVTKKMEERESERSQEHSALKDTLQEMKKEMSDEKNRHFGELAQFRNELLRREEDGHVLQLENQQLGKNLHQLSETLERERQFYSDKFTQLKNQKAARAKSTHRELAELSSQNSHLYEKLSKLKEQFDRVCKDCQNLNISATEERKASDEAIYEMKVILSRQRAFHREQIVGYENEVIRLDCQFNETMKREQELVIALHKIESKDNMRKNMRDVEREELEKINRLLI